MALTLVILNFEASAFTSICCSIVQIAHAGEPENGAWFTRYLDRHPTVVFGLVDPNQFHHLFLVMVATLASEPNGVFYQCCDANA